MTRRGFAEDDRGALSEGIAIVISAIVGIVVAVLVLWWASGFSVFYEDLFRVGPTVDGGGVGTDWTVGNTMPLLDFLIALTHAADVLMGAFILLMVFIHWASFRRLASQMQPPTRGERDTAVATDGGSDPSDAGTRRGIGRPDGGSERGDTKARGGDGVGGGERE